MKARRVARYAGAYALTAVLGLPIGWALAQRHDAGPASARGAVSLGAVLPVASSSPAQTAPHALTMTGSVAGLVPGRTVTLPVLVSNPNTQAIKILTIVVTAGNASAGCPAAGNLSVPGYDASRPGAAVYLIPGRGSATVPLTIQLVDAPNRDQSACRRVTFPLSYSGTAMQWGN